MTAADPFALGAAAEEIHLRLLATTDLHCEILAYDYYTDRPADAFGLVRTASLIREAAAEAQNTLILDAGDFLQGAPVGDLWAEEPERLDAAPHPMIAAMNAAGIEASTLGNHDFNYGLPFLERCLKDCAFPVVNANVVRGSLGETAEADELAFPGHAILERDYITRGGEVRRLRVGVIGFCPPQIMGWDAQLLTGHVDARDVVEAARVQIPRLRAAGADLVVALAHGGITPRPSVRAREQFARDLAEVPGIDVIVAGHQHLTFPGPDVRPSDGVDPCGGTLEGVPAVMAAFGGSRLGLIDLKLRPAEEGWQVCHHDSRTWPIAREEGGKVTAETQDDPTVAALAAPIHAEVLAYVRRPLARTMQPITTYFATATNAVALQIVAEAQAELARAALKDTEHGALPMLSVAAPFKAGGSFGPGYYTAIPPGPVALKHLLDLYLYPNTVCACVLTGAQLREWIERSAGLFLQVEPGAQDAPLLDPGFPTYNFDVVHGVTYRIDVTQPQRYAADGTLTRPEARRVIDLAHGGAPVAEDQRFVVITNGYRAGGGGRFPGADGSTKVWQCAETARAALIDRVTRLECLDLAPQPGWSFEPAPGTSVLYQSAPEAVDYLPEGLRLDPVGRRPDGFFDFRLHL